MEGFASHDVMYALVEFGLQALQTGREWDYSMCERGLAEVEENSYTGMADLSDTSRWWFNCV